MDGPRPPFHRRAPFTAGPWLRCVWPTRAPRTPGTAEEVFREATPVRCPCCLFRGVARHRACGGGDSQSRRRTGAGCRRRRSRRVQGSPLRGAAHRRPSLEGPPAGRRLVRRAQCGQVRAGMRAVDGWSAAERHERGLPVLERLDAGAVRDREAASARLDLRRRLQRRRHVVPGARRRQAGEARCRPGEHRVSGRHAGVLRPPGPECGIAASRLGQLRPARHDCRPPVDLAQHRGVRRGPGASHDLRRVRGRDRREHVVRVARGQGALSRRDFAERRLLRPEQQEPAARREHAPARGLRSVRRRVRQGRRRELDQGLARAGAREAARGEARPARHGVANRRRIRHPGRSIPALRSLDASTTPRSSWATTPTRA